MGAGMSVLFRGRLRRGLRDRLRDVRLLPRRLSGRARMTPSFVLLGAQKSGTTSLFRYLEAHPDVRPPLWKEPRYFDRHHHRGRRWYLAHFPTQREGVTGEATTGYLFDPRAAARMHAELPDAKLLVVLRDPVARAISHYHHEVRRGGERRSMEEAFAADLATTASRAPSEYAHFAHSYLTRGHYAPQLRRYLERFGPDALQVFEFGELFADPARHYADALAHLGLRPFTDVTFAKHNVGGGGAEGADVDGLRAHFRPHIDALEELLGRRFPWAR